MFRNTNFKPNTILATLPKRSSCILGKTRLYNQLVVWTGPWTITQLPPATECRKVMFSVVSIYRGSPRNHLIPCLLGTPQPCPSPILGLPCTTPGLFKLVHYVANTSILKRAVGLWLKGLLVRKKHSVQRRNAKRRKIPGLQLLNETYGRKTQKSRKRLIPLYLLSASKIVLMALTKTKQK